jgi:hypothetical protein
MGVQTFPPISSAVKKVQSGTTTAAGNVTIMAVNPQKTIVLSASKSSAGYVAVRGDLFVESGASANPFVKKFYNATGSFDTAVSSGRFGYLGNGSTNLTVKVYSARLVNSTTIYCDGPVEWQVIEYV